MYIQTEYTWYSTPNISTGLGLFWDDFATKNIPSETLTHAPTPILNSDFWGELTLQSP